MKRRIGGALVALGLMAGTSVALAAPAQAATGYARCPTGKFCIFSGANGSGTIGIYSNGDVNLGDSTGVTGLNNTAESYWNHGHPMCWGLWVDPSYDGAGLYVPLGGKGNLTGQFKNTVSSLSQGYCH